MNTAVIPTGSLDGATATRGSVPSRGGGLIDLCGDSDEEQNEEICAR